jgi:hypothetical protein
LGGEGRSFSIYNGGAYMILRMWWRTTCVVLDIF